MLISDWSSDVCSSDLLGLEALNRFSALAETKRDMVNTLLRAQGLPEIQRQIAWVPSPQTRGKFVAFTFDSEGKVVPGMGVVATKAEQLDEAIGRASSRERVCPPVSISRVAVHLKKKN